MRHAPLAILLALAYPNLDVYAEDTYIVTDPKGKAVFQVHFFGMGEHSPPKPPAPGVNNFHSTWSLTDAQKNMAREGLRYWAEVIQPRADYLPAQINVWTAEEENAEAIAPLMPNVPFDATRLQAALTGRNPMRGKESDAELEIGRLPIDSHPALPSQQPGGGNGDLSIIIRHELAHALGLTDTIFGYLRPRFAAKGSSWRTHLRDDNGNPARAGQEIMCSGCTPPADERQGFDLRRNRGYFSGEHVSEVLAGAMPGMPVKLNDENGLVNNDNLLHSGLTGSMVSHYAYRNYTAFMEAELAALQDLGYTIDRRNFFGHSVYGDGQTLANRSGYFARNAEGTGYLAGQANGATLGLGLHVYGSRNRISQQADLLTVGAGGAGVRVDGEGNTISIEPGVRVHADGLNGRGVMFAYGKGHALIQRGDVEALGEHGVALNFDFGHNASGDQKEYRGSYIRQGARLDNIALLPELAGALADNVDISGRVAGRAAAIHIADNALVGTINVMQGAQLQGDILSRYDQKDAAGQQRLTRLAFGRRADAQGRASDAADADFRFRYDGNISGPRNLELQTRGGITTLNGKVEVYAVHIGAGSTLGGAGSYALAPGGTFVNDGTLAAGDAIGRIAIQGNYRQTAQGQLRIRVDGQGRHDTLAVNGNAALAGRLTFVPVPGWYAPGWSTEIDSPVSVTGTTSGAFDLVQIEPPPGAPSMTVQARTAGYRLGAGEAATAPATLLADSTGQAPQTRAAAAVAVPVQPFAAERETGGVSGTGQTDSPTLTVQTAAQDGNRFRLSLTRATDAYSRYGDDANARAAGTALDRAAATATAALQPLYRALDFSAKDGSEVARGLHQLSPAGYSALFASSLDRERQLTALVDARERALSGESAGSDWQSFVVPFGSQARQAGDGAQIGYQSTGQGVLFGADTPLASGRWRVGLHGAVSHQSTRASSPDSGDGKVNAAELGVHARYAADPAQGGYWLGQARLGAEDASMDRNVAVGDYRGQNKAQWTGAFATLSAGGGYRWTLNRQVKLGVLAGLDYSRIARPALAEQGSATQLKLDAAHADAWQSRLGVDSGFNIEQASGTKMDAGLQLVWAHQLRAPNVTQHAELADSGFASSNRLAGRDALNVSVGLRYLMRHGPQLGLDLSSDLLRSGYDSMSGNLSVNWSY
jgi:subtilase-type serine protease